LRRNCIFNKDGFEPNRPYSEVDEPFCDWLFASWTILKIWIWTDDKFIETEIIDKLDDGFDENLSKFQIYLHTWSDLNGFTGYLYNHDSKGGEETWFGRYLLIKEVSDGENTVDSDKLLKIESHVLYKRWYLTGEKVMETFIWNYEFNQ
jgi:hypothetical protein